MATKKGIETIEKPVEKVKFSDEKVDVIASFEVIEHLFSPRDLIIKCASILSPGGILILTCPNVQGFDISVLQKLSNSVDFEHLNYFNPSSLSPDLQNTYNQQVVQQTHEYYMAHPSQEFLDINAQYNAQQDRVVSVGAKGTSIWQPGVGFFQTSENTSGSTAAAKIAAEVSRTGGATDYSLNIKALAEGANPADVVFATNNYIHLERIFI